MMQTVQDIKKLLSLEILQVTGCTEPVSVAYAFRTARRHLSVSFDPATCKARLTASPEVLRNASTAMIPFLNRRGLRTAVAAGLSARADQFDLLPHMDLAVAQHLLGRRSWLTVIPAPDKKGIYVQACLSVNGETVRVIINGRHDEIRSIRRNTITLYKAPSRPRPKIMSVTDILYAVSKRNRSLESIAEDFIVRQVRGNPRLPMDKRLAELIRDRMCGSSAPIMTLGGSGNHGILLGVPLHELYRQKGRTILPSVLLTLLVDIHLTAKQRRISDECGLGTKAAPALAAGLAHARGARPEQIKALLHSVSDELGHLQCHGARPSCGNKGRKAYTTAMRLLESSRV